MAFNEAPSHANTMRTPTVHFRAPTIPLSTDENQSEVDLDIATDRASLSPDPDESDPLPLPLEGILEVHYNQESFGGSFSQVYQGKWYPPGESVPMDVAVKKLTINFNSVDSAGKYRKPAAQYTRLNKRVRREARALAIAQHPRVVSLCGYRLGDSDKKETPVLITPWYRNGNLFDYIGHVEPDFDGRIKLAIQMAEGLAHLHRQGMVHGDVKPANVLIDENGDAAIADFGLSLIKQLSGMDATSGPFSGTPYFVAPEVYNNGIREFPIDVYAFGGNLLTIFDGRPPFYHYRGIRKTFVVTDIMAGKTARREDHTNVTQEWLWCLIEWCWSQRPEDRPTMEQVLQCLASRTAPSKPPSPAT